MRSRVKSAIVRLALWGLLPTRYADTLVSALQLVEV